MAAPFEILAAPFDVWLAPVGTAFPAVNVAPGGSFFKLGSNGAANYAEEGITVTHDQTVETFRGLRGTGPVKAFRTAEGLLIAFTLHDVTAEQYGKILNNLAVTDIANGGGNAGHRDILLHLGPDVAVYALLARATGASPYGDGWNMQYQVPAVFQSGNPAPVLRKGNPAGLALAFMALEDLTAATEGERFGKLVIQDAPVA